ncbi:MAG TPA: isocitrate/isopropylmalate family dehydrogenase [Solirubrobacterales bacterium]
MGAAGITLVVRDAGDQPALLEAARELLAAIPDVELAEAGGLPEAAEPGRAYLLTTTPDEGERGRIRDVLDPHSLVAQVRHRPMLARYSPLRKKRIEGLDLAVVAAQPGRETEAVTLAAQLAEQRVGRLCAVGSPLAGGEWQAAVERGRAAHPDVEVESLGPGEVAGALLAEPGRFDVVVGAAALGDGLVGQAVALTGTPTLYAAALVGAEGAGAYFPFAAPDQPDGYRNPLPLALAVGLALRFSLGRDEHGTALEDAVDLALETGLRPPDIYAEHPGEQRVGTATLQRALMQEVGWALGTREPSAPGA